MPFKKKYKFRKKNFKYYKKNFKYYKKNPKVFLFKTQFLDSLNTFNTLSVKDKATTIISLRKQITGNINKQDKWSINILSKLQNEESKPILKFNTLENIKGSKKLCGKTVVYTAWFTKFFTKKPVWSKCTIDHRTGYWHISKKPLRCSFKALNEQLPIWTKRITNHRNKQVWEKVPYQSWRWNLVGKHFKFKKKSVSKSDYVKILEWTNEDLEFSPNTVRNTYFRVSTELRFKKILNYLDLPIDFDLERFELIRYMSQFYGYNYQANLFSYNLWSTMGFKKNLAVPFQLCYNTNTPRKNFLASINKLSWKYYAYLTKNSFIKLNKIFINKIVDSIYLTKNMYSGLSDFSIWNLRTKFKFNRVLSLNNDDIDYSVSSYHFKFYYYDYRARSRFFWIANNSSLKELTFYINSYDATVLLLPRKYLKSLRRLEKITKFYRSWNFSFITKKISKYIVNKNLFTIFWNYNFKIYNYNLNEFSNIKKNYKFIFLLINNFFNKNSKRLLFDEILINNNLKLIINFLILLKNNLCLFNFSFKNKALIFLGNKQLMGGKIILPYKRLTNIYFKSKGYFKVRIKRLLVKRGFIKIRSLGIKHSLRVIRKAKYFLNAKWKWFNKDLELADLAHIASNIILRFLFFFIQKNWNINFNFLDYVIVENFNFQLYVFLYNFFEMIEVINSVKPMNLLFKIKNKNNMQLKLLFKTVNKFIF